jgi:hypothetical protein
MSVTKPTLNEPPLDDALLEALVVALDAPPALELLLLLLLPHADSTKASAPALIAARRRSLILPFTRSPLIRTENATINLSGDVLSTNGPPQRRSPNVTQTMATIPRVQIARSPRESA